MVISPSRALMRLDFPRPTYPMIPMSSPYFTLKLRLERCTIESLWVSSVSTYAYWLLGALIGDSTVTLRTGGAPGLLAVKKCFLDSNYDVANTLVQERLQ